jgi:hypothetical protein
MTIARAREIGLSLALNLEVGELDDAYRYHHDRRDYDYQGDGYVPNVHAQLADSIARVQSELMRLSKIAEGPVDPIPSGECREAHPEVSASPSHAAGPCACGRYSLGAVSVVRGGALNEDHRYESCVVNATVTRRPCVP